MRAPIDGIHANSLLHPLDAFQLRNVAGCQPDEFVLVYLHFYLLKPPNTARFSPCQKIFTPSKPAPRSHSS